jgi:hypothetical protein
VARELDLPPAIRAPILLEIAADLEAVYDAELRRGCGEDEAARRAEERVLGSSQSVRRLGRLHREGWRMRSGEVAARLGRGVDLLLVVLGVVPMLLAAGAVAASALDRSIGPATWILVALGGALLALVGTETARLVRGLGARGGALAAVLVLSLLAPTLGALILGVKFYGAATDPAPAALAALDQVRVASMIARDGSALVLGLLLGIAGGMAWFILLHRSAALLASEIGGVLEAEGPPPAERAAARVLPLVRRGSS